VVLVSPQIPQNAGSVARTCAATNIALHLVGPLGFEIDDRRCARAAHNHRIKSAAKHHTRLSANGKASHASVLTTRPRRLKRAGLDYWEFVVVDVHKDWQAFDEFRRRQPGSGRLVAFSKFGRRHHATPDTFLEGDWLLFGAETTGLPDEVRQSTGT